MPFGIDCLIPFDEPIAAYSLPENFTYPFNYTPHPLCLLAVNKLQRYLKVQTEWEHNFGLEEGKAGTIIGKMFGVLLVRTEENEIGFLAAFSGKLAGSYHHANFVPPVYDSLLPGSFLNTGMQELTQMNAEITSLESFAANDPGKIALLKQIRKQHSLKLQEKLFDQYQFLNQAGEEKSLRTVFRENTSRGPGAGAGDCAVPKLLQYAFQQGLKPLAMAEFWWGLSPKSAFWKHGHFYPACHEKCAPVLAHMLAGIAIDKKPESKAGRMEAVA
ncbi:pseudouridylate synthase [Adhaeribacter sp. BT258]|uniref:Pseudouridylate synthase n=1 Tax=Adhaeribacter terrigena TaxID=2793070 RepID=A0ABS1C402_9BACT|nr:pseudouridylate synthase [Adhaeribacter terrigena]